MESRLCDTSTDALTELLEVVVSLDVALSLMVETIILPHLSPISSMPLCNVAFLDSMLGCMPVLVFAYLPTCTPAPVLDRNPEANHDVSR